VGLVRFRQRQLFGQRLDCIYLDLPRGDPGVAEFCGPLDTLGFFFSGILPEYYEGDILPLQCLNNMAIDAQQIQLASDFGKQLLAYVLQAQLSSGGL
jgi:serine/threonine-protein kinase RsbW